MGTDGQTPLLRRLRGAAAARKRTRQRAVKEPDPVDLQRSHERGRGRDAESPLEVPPPGWKDILLRLRKEIQDDQLSLIASGVAYYFMLALFPALLALVAVYGVIADPASVAQQAGELMRLMPADAAKVLAAQLQEIST